MKKLTIAFFDAKPYDINSFDSTNKNFGYKFKYFEEHLNEDTVNLTKGFDIVCAFVNDSITEKVINILYENNVKLIAMRCAGYNNVDLNASYKKLHIVRVPMYSPYAVAEHAIALILTLNRKTHKAFNRTREGNFNINGLLGFDLYGKTVGVLGTGKIGKIFINILKGFGTKVLAYDLYPDLEYAKQNGFTYTDIDTIYKESDIISLHLPLTKESHHIINQESISKMKDNVMIINTSRGALIDTKALIEGLKDKKIGAAGLDVYEEENEYFFEDFSHLIVDDDVLARLMTFNNVLITSHQAFFTKEALKNIAETTLNNIKEFFENNILQNEICYKCGAGTCVKKTEGKCF
ncbi:MAG: hydroxyacid dehydrogenase [Spirochaetes bacterium GWD1_27_9]|nr:MAG: hydroxyacid dehydrogenase [Spirochaetes bacterium GWB1_27_13]OHD21484.1 MAG: hydroxyacid dehydrogenase [Spirochaetes bacterium GWC1_27_15]OHD42450.1 MAG: hydroxyacid dehydrogenase [Spirochaetes bacterium GWD1_27_9]